MEYFKNCLYTRLDDWIVYGLKNENSVINNSLNEIKYFI